jgi:hypothetical protein
VSMTRTESIFLSVRPALARLQGGVLRLFRLSVIAQNEERRSNTMPKVRTGLDGRHEDIDGRIDLKRSDALNKNLPHPIPEFVTQRDSRPYA